jgi:secreted trypsin-like serine protease
MASLFRTITTVCFAGFLAAPAFAGEPSFNWMRDYVQKRVMVRTAEALPANDAQQTLSGGSIQPRIVGGTTASASIHPFQVGLLNKSTSSNYDAQFCGGTLYKSRYVITAAHCSDFVTAAEVQVLVGTQSLSSGGTRVNVKKITISPKWNPDTFDYDVAIWELKAAQSGYPSPSLAASDPAVGTAMTVTGWGATNKAGTSYPKQLQQASVPLYNRKDCNGPTSYQGSITARMLCAGYTAGGVDSCQGDSGGPLTSGSGKNVLTGIVSWGNGCAKPNYPGVYTRISASGISNFIKDNTK